jgi:hypothetical protein
MRGGAPAKMGKKMCRTVLAAAAAAKTDDADDDDGSKHLAPSGGSERHQQLSGGARAVEKAVAYCQRARWASTLCRV